MFSGEEAPRHRWPTASDKTGTAIRSLATDLPADSLAGFTFGPDKKVYFTDKRRGRVMRIDPL
jgi:hypothetical protein